MGENIKVLEHSSVMVEIVSVTFVEHTYNNIEVIQKKTCVHK